MSALAHYRQRFFDWLPENNRLERIWFIAKTDFKRRYYGSFLGLLWALLNPVLRLLIYYLVFTLIFQTREEYFILHLFLGLIMFLFFVEVVSRSMKMMHSKGYLFENIQVHKIDVYLANLLAGFFGLLFNLIVFLVFRLIIVPEPISWEALFLVPILLLNLIVFTLGFGLLLSITWTFFRDIQHFWDLLRLAMLWLSGVFFTIDPTLGWKTNLLAHLTPLAGLLINGRALLLYHDPVNWELFWFDLVYGLVLFIFAWSLFRRYAPRALEIL